MKPGRPSSAVRAYLLLCKRLGKEPTTVREMSRRLGLSAAQVRYAMQILGAARDGT